MDEKLKEKLKEIAQSKIEVVFSSAEELADLAGLLHSLKIRHSSYNFSHIDFYDELSNIEKARSWGGNYSFKTNSLGRGLTHFVGYSEHHNNITIKELKETLSEFIPKIIII